MRFGAFRKLGRCGLLRESFPKKQDWRRPLTQSLRDNVRRSSIRGLIACRCAGKRAFLRECGFLVHTSPLNAGKLLAWHSRAMRPRWLAWAAFILTASFLRVLQRS